MSLQEIRRKDAKTRPAKRIDQFDESDLLIRKILDNQELSDNQEQSLARLKQVAGILTSYKPNQAQKIIQKAFCITRGAAWILTQKTKHFFGELDQVNAKTERALQKMRLENLLYHPGITIEQQLKIEKLLMDLLGTDKVDQESKRSRRIRAVYTQNPQALQGDAVGVEITE